ncbi:MAG: MoxR family ATPase [Candidatus Hydrogenedentes bacterium]|nr:MoxR family ATPase [Candidatus Hydrogenedentota bacterium]
MNRGAATMTDHAAELHSKLETLRENLAKVIRGKADSLDTLIIAMAAGGSVLMEDIPGVGKTTLAKALATSINATFSRIQFTPDLLPADILGSSIYDPARGVFNFSEGPVFCNVLLADEINRASPRTQSALLEAMSEGQATIEGKRHVLDKPFFVLATQNPIEFHGTYPLPEAQLDRFLALLRLGYPDADTEVDILFAQAERHPLEDLQPVLSRDEVIAIQRAVAAVKVERTVAQYIIALVQRTREDPRLRLGVSPRGSLMLFRASQATAFLAGRAYVLPDDVQRCAVPVLAHRVILTSKAKYGGDEKPAIIAELVEGVRVPT